MAEAHAIRTFANGSDKASWQGAAAIETIVDRASARGDKPVGLTGSFVAAVIFGLIWYRSLATDGLLDDNDVTALEALLTGQRGNHDA